MKINLGMTLNQAKRAHHEQGGYLLWIGQAGGSLSTDRDCYAVCDEETAIDGYGRTAEQLRHLDTQGWSEANGTYPPEMAD